MQYVGQTCRTLQKRFGEHYRRIRKPKNNDTFLYQHFKRTGHSPNDVIIQPVEKISYHRENMSVKCVPLQTPLLYSKTGVCRGISTFLIFAPKHRLWVLVRTASARRFKRVHTIYVLSKNKKNIKIFQLKIFNFQS